ncbi:MAG: winged helix-turn-helix domain-containing protein [Kiritimatiellae bacterium]|nr:winged helix-turn-helix domain-containing protein [Kiritimatiellia bacterium]
MSELSDGFVRWLFCCPFVLFVSKSGVPCGRKSGTAAPIVHPGPSTVSVCFPRPVESAPAQMKKVETSKADKEKTTEKATEKATEKTTEKTTEKLSGKIVRLLEAQPTISMRGLAAKCGVTEDGIYWHLKKLKASGRIRRVGPDKGGHWEVVRT